MRKRDVRRNSRFLERFVLAAVLLTGITACGEAPLVDDAAQLMGAAEKENLSRHHRFLLKDHDIDYRVVTGNRLGDINLFAADRFQSDGVGTQGRSGRGLLLVIDAAADLVRLEVSANLEGIYPDAFVAYVEQRQMVPFFRAERVADGILATTELIVARAQRAKANAGFDGEAWYVGSGGGGASAPAHLGKRESRTNPPRRGRPGNPAAAGATPEQTLTAYFQAMRARDPSPDLAIYTPETTTMLRGWVVTRAQMDNVVKTYRRCGSGETKLGPKEARAAIRYAVNKRQCAPFFFRKTSAGWALDLTVMQTLIRFGRDNSWHFAAGAPNPYTFAFADWRIDSRGYPWPRKH